MIFSSTKYHRLHTCGNNNNNTFLNTSGISDKTYYSLSLQKQNSRESNKPLLSFTSFQHYLEDSNQNEFYKKEHQRLHRSANKAKTQAYFTYQREKSNSSQSKRKHLKNPTLQDSIIQPFHPVDTNSIKHINKNKSNRKIASKSSSDNYLTQNHSIAEDIFNQKFGTIQAWNSQQKHDHKIFVSSKNILQEKKLNSIIKNRMLKNSQNSFRKENTQNSLTENSQYPAPKTAQIQSSKKPFKSKNKHSSNKQNIYQSQPQQKPINKIILTQNQDYLFRPIEISHKQYTKNNPLTQINELQEEILLSRRQQKFPGSFLTRYHHNHEVLQLQTSAVRENYNIKMLKKQFQYLCKNDLDETIEGYHKSPSQQLQPNSSLKSCNKQTKYFKRFPNHENNTTCYPFDTTNYQQKTNRPKTTQDEINHSSPNMLKILQSINYTTSNEKCLYEARTPMKRKKIPQSDANTPHNTKKDDMKSISKQRERFHSSINDRKSQSAFNYTNGFVVSDSQQKRGINRVINQNKSNPLVITVVSSFKSCESRQNTSKKYNSKNCSILNKFKSRLLTENESQGKQNTLSKTQKGTSLFEKDFLAHTRTNEQAMENQHFDDIRINESMSQTIDIIHNQSQENSILAEQNQSLQKLNMLSQQLKKCTKTPITTKYINLANKKFMYLNKASRINTKDLNQSTNIHKNDKKNVIKNLTITQLQGRHIQKLRKRFDINNP